MFVDRIREQGWYRLVYDNIDVDGFYHPDLVKKVYVNIDPSTINIDLNQFVVHFNSSNLIISIDLIHELTQLLISPQNVAPLVLIDLHALDGYKVH